MSNAMLVKAACVAVRSLTASDPETLKNGEVHPSLEFRTPAGLFDPVGSGAHSFAVHQQQRINSSDKPGAAASCLLLVSTTSHVRTLKESTPFHFHGFSM